MLLSNNLPFRFVQVLLAGLALLVNPAVAATKTLDLIPAEAEAGALRLAVSGSADQMSGELHLQVRLANLSDAALTFNPGDIDLLTEQGWRSQPGSAGGPNWLLAAHSEQQYGLVFKPINSMALFQLTGFTGDFEPRYRLRLAPLEAGNAPVEINLALAPQAYAGYLAHGAREADLHLHLPELNREQFIERQSRHLAGQFAEEYPESPSITAASEQQVINGMAFQWRLYQQDQTAILALQFVNHSSRDVIFDSALINLQVGEKKYPVSNDFSALPEYLQRNVVEGSDAHRYQVKSGERFGWRFQFDAALAGQRPLVHLDGVRVAGKALFDQALTFARVDTSNW